MSKEEDAADKARRELREKAIRRREREGYEDKAKKKKQPK